MAADKGPGAGDRPEAEEVVPRGRVRINLPGAVAAVAVEAEARELIAPQVQCIARRSLRPADCLSVDTGQTDLHKLPVDVCQCPTEEENATATASLETAAFPHPISRRRA